MYVGDELAHCGKSIVIGEDGGMWRGARRTDHLSKTIGRSADQADTSILVMMR